ncbi:hypothetical protein NDU88_001570 [Pleurodeles waltl]|uniref:Uncharacterized protein n=1 Tax=Pleurodeles waltl TaxID=8319 RepID=A0AAV7SZX0_PLEWA|nr:hypothetical protein NDU88_001570 [Pleurodeles waltl]
MASWASHMAPRAGCSSRGARPRPRGSDAGPRAPCASQAGALRRSQQGSAPGVPLRRTERPGRVRRKRHNVTSRLCTDCAEGTEGWRANNYAPKTQ